MAADQPLPSSSEQPDRPIWLTTNPSELPEGSMPEQPDNEFFIRQAVAQDSRRACELLFRLYYAPLCSHAVRFVHDRQLAEDLVADVFLQFWAQKHYEHVTTSYRSYLFRAVRNRAYNHIRWEFNRQEPIQEASDRPDAETIQPDRLLLQDELQFAIEEAIRQLPQQRQRVLIMSRFEGKKYKEIAKEMGLTPKTVENHLLRGLSTLRQLLIQKNLLSWWLLLALTTGSAA